MTPEETRARLLYRDGLMLILDKPAGIYCQHCIPGKGCGIYETRFEICRGFLCGWRQVPQLGDDWRPDHSGILMMMQEVDTLPDEHRAEHLREKA